MTGIKLLPLDFPDGFAVAYPHFPLLQASLATNRDGCTVVIVYISLCKREYAGNFYVLWYYHSDVLF
jgi:hypothetical protein